MCLQQLEDDFQNAIVYDDIETVCAMHSGDSKQFNVPNCNNKQVFERFINFANDKIDSHLSLAVSSGSVKVVEYFLKNGAKLTGTEWIQDNSFFEIIKTRREMLKLLLQHGLNTEIRNGLGLNILHDFISNFVDQDAVEITEILLDAGVPINETDDSGYSALHFAIKIQSMKLASFLIQRGADVNQKASDEFKFLTPLYLAVQLNDINLVYLLLSNGADINGKDKWKVLHSACLNHNDQMISLLIRKGATINVDDKRSRTPLSLLDPKENNYEQCLIAMIKELSKLSFANLPISASDMKKISNSPVAQEHFEKCTNELKQMSRDKFYPPYSYFSVLKMANHTKKLAGLTKNEEFVKAFNKNLSFTYYENDLRRIFKDAVQVKIRLEEVVSRLDAVFKDFLPEIVVRKLAENLRLEDLPLQ